MSSIVGPTQFEHEQVHAQVQVQVHDLGNETEQEHGLAEDKEKAGRAPVIPLRRSRGLSGCWAHIQRLNRRGPAANRQISEVLGFYTGRD